MSFWQKFFTKKANQAGQLEIRPDASQEKLEQTKVFACPKSAKTPKPALPACLKIVSGPDAGYRMAVQSKQINIGRLPGSELLLTDAGVSRLHAFIVTEDGQHMLYDGKSMNGTYLNNKRITKQVLNPGDLIKIANTVLLYELQ